MDSDGSNLVQATHTPAGTGNFHPSWAPDGKRIAFTQAPWDGNLPPPVFRQPPLAGGDILVVDTETATVTTLVDDPADDDQPAWGANGQILFTSNRAGNADIFAVQEDGSGISRLTDHPAVDVEPAWTPNGFVLFASDREHGAFEIFLMNASGGNLQRLTATLGGNAQPNGGRQ